MGENKSDLHLEEEKMKVKLRWNKKNCGKDPSYSKSVRVNEEMKRR